MPDGTRSDFPSGRFQCLVERRRLFSRPVRVVALPLRQYRYARIWNELPLWLIRFLVLDKRHGEIWFQSFRKTLSKVHQRVCSHAPHLSNAAKLVKLADKTCNLRDVAESPPSDWSLKRKREYFDWAAAVVEGLRGTNIALEKAFDRAYKRRS